MVSWWMVAGSFGDWWLASELLATNHQLPREPDSAVLHNILRIPQILHTINPRLHLPRTAILATLVRTVASPEPRERNWKNHVYQK